MSAAPLRNGAFTAIGPIPQSCLDHGKKTMSDLLYLAGGAAALLVFAAYAALLKRA